MTTYESLREHLLAAQKANTFAEWDSLVAMLVDRVEELYEQSLKNTEAEANPHHPKPLTKPSPLDRESS